MNDSILFPASESAVASTSRSTLDHLALLSVRGPEARSFLDTQLTRNVPLTEAGASASHAMSRASVAGYCSPKGRLLATFVVWSAVSPAPTSAGETIFLLTSRDIAPMVAKRLRMYVLRAKLVIDDVTAAHAIEGFHDASALPDAVRSLDVWEVLGDDDETWIRHPDADGLQRLMRIRPASNTMQGAPLVPVDPAMWRWSQIRAGIPRVTTTTQDRFVPQMVNLEALGGVDFKKGCFPGQEVVARSQYLGKLKRRMALATVDVTLDEFHVVAPPVTDVWSAEDNGPVGLVVNAERGPDGRVSMLVELPLARFGSHGLTIADNAGAALKIESLPYQLPDNEVFVRPKF